MMSGIKGKNTKPELVIRHALHKAGFRYRLHDKRLPGKPDLVLPKYNAVIFVNGCFWHGHGCHLFKWPSTRQEWWRTKITKTVQIDQDHLRELSGLGWRVATVWECALKGRTRRDFDEVIDTLAAWLQSGESTRLEIAGNETPKPIT